MPNIKSSINKGITFLKSPFSREMSRSYGTEGLFGFDTLFPSILILDSLNQVKSSKAKKICSKIVDLLLNEKSDFWSFNYWFKNTTKFKTEPYPDDLDDTFCALSAIFNFNKKLLKGDDYAKIINLLVLCEDKEGGPYRTWILPKEKSKNWDDIDLAVNSNVAYFLKTQDIELENINNFIENKIKNNELKSPFYKGDLPIIYFISRFYKGKFTEKLKDILISKTKDIQSSLDMALIISSLIRLGYTEFVNSNLIEKLIKKQSKNGSWETSDFYFYIDKKSGTDYIGSSALTTAFVLEALSLYLNQKIKTKTDSSQLKLDKYKQLIIKKANANLNYLPNEIKKPILSFLNKISTSDKDGIIILTPIYTAFSLSTANFKKIPKDFLIQLGMINLYGWCAYTIYDDIIDKDADVSQLPLANIFCREMDILFNNLNIPKSTGFLKLYRQTMQNLEYSNYWELQHCRFVKTPPPILPDFGNYQNLAARSMGHALTSVAILCHLGYSTHSATVKNFYEFFKNFIIARQMNDDVHDWQKDLEMGQINSAGKLALELPKTKNRDELQSLFWQKIIPDYCQKIIEFGEKATTILNKISIIKNKTNLHKPVNKIIDSAKLALTERQKTLDFIKNYY